MLISVLLVLLGFLLSEFLFCYLFLLLTWITYILECDTEDIDEVFITFKCLFAACKRPLKLRGIRILGQMFRNISRQRRVLPSAAGGLSRRWTWRHLAEKVGTSKGGGKKWQPTPKNLPRKQRARAIAVTWMGCGSC
jgi:hypothetical protein